MIKKAEILWSKDKKHIKRQKTKKKEKKKQKKDRD